MYLFYFLFHYFTFNLLRTHEQCHTDTCYMYKTTHFRIKIFTGATHSSFLLKTVCIRIYTLSITEGKAEMSFGLGFILLGLQKDTYLMKGK